jgi:hypothetical protein
VTERIPSLALAIMSTCLAVYAAIVIAGTRRIGIDLGLLCFALLGVLLVLSSLRGQHSLWFERTAAYVGVLLVVYLDQTNSHKPQMLTTVSWILIGITGAAACMRFMLSPSRRFELTTLDLIVIFVALVLPNLPGSVALPPDLPAGVAKAVILLYVVEGALTSGFRRALPRVFIAVTLAAIAGRALLSGVV